MAKQKGITLQRFSGAEFAAALATALQDPNGMAYYVYVDDETGQLVFPAPPSPTMPVGQVDSAGRVRQGNATGSMPVVEDNSSAISASNTVIQNQTSIQTIDHSIPTFGATPWASTTTKANAHPRLFQSTLTATAGGEILAADVGPPTLAGYQGCMIVTHFWSDSTQANITMAVTTSAGALSQGIASFDLSTTANTVTPDWNKGLAWQAGTDAATIQFSCAAGQAAANQVIVVCGTYHYET